MRVLLNRGQDVTEITGLVNVHRRLRIKYGEQSGLQLAQGKLGGLQVIITIPLEEVNHDV